MTAGPRAHRGRTAGRRLRRGATGGRPPAGSGASASASPTIAAFQQQIEATYFERDRRRGLAGTFVWFVEEVGELARALKKGEPENLREEFGDVLAWLSTLASLAGVDLARASLAYSKGCPTCHEAPCVCPMKSTPIGPSA